MWQVYPLFTANSNSLYWAADNIRTGLTPLYGKAVKPQLCLYSEGFFFIFLSAFFIEIMWHFQPLEGVNWGWLKVWQQGSQSEGWTMTTGGHLSSYAGYWHAAKKGCQQFSSRNNSSAIMLLQVSLFFLPERDTKHIFHVKPNQCRGCRCQQN